MPRTTSLHKFNDALDELVGADITIKREPVQLTVADRNAVPLSGPRWGRTIYDTKVIDAALVTVTGRSTANAYWSRDPDDTTTVQALLDEQGKYHGGYTPYDRGRTVEQVERASRIRTSQPFDWVPVSLTDLLKSLERFDPAAIASADAQKAEGEARHKTREEERQEAERQEARKHMIAARAEALTALGDAATDAVLDYFLPLP